MGTMAHAITMAAKLFPSSLSLSLLPCRPLFLYPSNPAVIFPSRNTRCTSLVCLSVLVRGPVLSHFLPQVSSSLFLSGCTSCFLFPFFFLLFPFFPTPSSFVSRFFSLSSTFSSHSKRVETCSLFFCCNHRIDRVCYTYVLPSDQFKITVIQADLFVRIVERKFYVLSLVNKLLKASMRTSSHI